MPQNNVCNQNEIKMHEKKYCFQHARNLKSNKICKCMKTYCKSIKESTQSNAYLKGPSSALRQKSESNARTDGWLSGCICSNFLCSTCFNEGLSNFRWGSEYSAHGKDRGEVEHTIIKKKTGGFGNL